MMNEEILERNISATWGSMVLLQSKLDWFICHKDHEVRERFRRKLRKELKNLKKTVQALSNERTYNRIRKENPSIFIDVPF